MNTNQMNDRHCRGALFVLLGAMFITGCATSAPPRPTQFPSTVSGWHGMDRVEFVQDWSLNSYSQILLEPADTSSATLPPKDENTYQPTVTVLQRTDGIFLGELNRAVGGNPPATMRDTHAALPERVLLLRTKVVDIHPGSQAARYWGGFGAGAAWVKISGEVMYAGSSAVLLRFEQQRIGSMGAFGGAYVPLLTDCIGGIGYDVGRTISAFRNPKNDNK